MEEWAITSFRDEYRFLSNFFPSPVLVAGIEFSTVEHAYQAAKSKNREDWERIASLPTPGEAKKQGQVLTVRPDWDEVKPIFMYKLVQQKFKILDLRERLLLTGDAPLVEGNHWHDTYWGMCTCEKHEGSGANRLGRILMLVRDQIKEEVNA